MGGGERPSITLSPLKALVSPYGKVVGSIGGIFAAASELLSLLLKSIKLSVGIPCFLNNNGYLNKTKNEKLVLIWDISRLKI